MIAHSHSQSLLDWVDSYELSHAITDETAAGYRRSIRNLQRWSGAELTAETLRDDLVNRALMALLRAGRSPHYARSLKSGVLAVWRDMADAGLCEHPRRIRPIRSGAPKILVWSPEQMQQLLEAAQRLPGEFRTLKLSRSRYFDTMMRTAWDTALRRRDLHRLRHDEIGPDWVDKQNKTRKPVRARLRASTLAKIEEWGRGPEAVLWPLWGCDECFRATWDKIVAMAGLPHAPWKTIRKSAGTAGEAVQPGAGHLLLGNTRRVFERHYLQAGIVAGPQPPELA